MSSTYERRDGIRQRTGPNPWQARVVDENGKSVAKSFRTKTEAKKWRVDTLSAIGRGEGLDEVAGDRRFADVAEEWAANNRRTKAPGTWRRDDSYMRAQILPTFGEMKVRNIRPTHVEDWLAASERKEATKAKALQIVRSVLERSRKNRAFLTNPVDDVSDRPSPTRGKRKGRALTDAETHVLIQAAYATDDRLAELRRRPPAHVKTAEAEGRRKQSVEAVTVSVHPTAFAVVAIVRLGLRASEALGLEWQDFDMKARQVTVRRSIDRDGTVRPLKARGVDDFRTINLPDDVVDALALHRETVSPQHQRYLFVDKKGTRLTYGVWRRSRFAPTVKLAGLDGVVSHDLRRTFITRAFIVDGWTPAQVMAVVGHSSSRITLEIYTDVNAENVPAASVLLVG